MNGFTELTVDNYVPQPCLFENMLIDLTQQYDKLVFVGLSESDTFPRWEGAPKGRMRNGET